MRLLFRPSRKSHLDVAQRRSGQDFLPIRDVLIEALIGLNTYLKPRGYSRYPYRFRDLDRLTSGLQPSDFVVVAARPSMGGKTSLCLNIAQHVALNEGQPVALF